MGQTLCVPCKVEADTQVWEWPANDTVYAVNPPKASIALQTGITYCVVRRLYAGLGPQLPTPNPEQ